jgi:hypothetical protein
MGLCDIHLPSGWHLLVVDLQEDPAFDMDS